MRTGRVAGPGLAGRNIAEHTCLRGHRRALADRVVSAHAGLPRDNAAILDAHRSRDPDLRHDEAEAPDPTVVRDVHEIVDLRAGANHGVVDAAAIDRRVRANLDVVFDDATTDVRNLVMAATAKNVTEAVGAKPRAGMHDYPLTDHHSGVCRDGRIQVTLRTHVHVGAEDDMRVDHDIVLDPGTGANHRERTDAD